MLPQNSIIKESKLQVSKQNELEYDIPHVDSERKLKQSGPFLSIYQTPLIRSDPDRGLKGNLETDINFAYDVLEIEEAKKIVREEEKAEGDVPFIKTEQTKRVYEEIHHKCILHSQANRFNHTTSMVFSEITPQKNKCKCGCKRAKGKRVSILCMNLADLDSKNSSTAYMGPGIILFFQYLKSIIFLLLLFSLLYALYPLLLNILKGDSYDTLVQDCANSYTVTQWYCQIKARTQISNRQTDLQNFYLIIQLSVGVLSVLVLILGYFYIRLKGVLTNEVVDGRLDSTSDYCIKIDNLPAGNYTEKDLLEYIETLYESAFQGQKCRIKSVQIIYNLSEFRSKVNLLNQLLSSISKLLTSKERQRIALQSGFTHFTKQEYFEYHVQKSQETIYLNLKRKILKTYNEILNFRERFINEQAYRQSFASNTCIIEFLLSKQQQKFLEHYGKQRAPILTKLKEKVLMNCCSCCNKDQTVDFGQSLLDISRAPEPSDINWQNCEKEFKLWRVALVWLITLLTVGVSLGVLIGISELRKNVPEVAQFSIFITISLQIFNRVIWLMLVAVIGIEQHNTKSDAIVSIMQKASIAQAINVVVLPIILNLVLKDNFSGPDGLSGLVLDFQFTVFFTMIFWNLINPPYQLKKLGICIPYFRNRKIFELSKVVSPEYTYPDIFRVLKYYEQPEFPKAGVYVYMITTVTQALFFSYIQPLLPFVVTLNLILFMFINRYLVFQRSKIPPLTDMIVFEQCIKLSLRIPFYFAAGTLFFLLYIGERDWVFLGIAIFGVILGVLGVINIGDVFSDIAKLPFLKILSIKEQHKKDDRNEEKISNNPESQRGQHLPELKSAKTSTFPSKTTSKNTKQDSSTASRPAEIVFSSNLEVKKSQEPPQVEAALNSQIKMSQIQLLPVSKAKFNKSKKQKKKPIKKVHFGLPGEGFSSSSSSSDSSSSDETSDSEQTQRQIVEKVQKVCMKKVTPLKRRQSYYKNCNLNQLFYFEGQFADINTASYELSRKFCEEQSNDHRLHQKLNQEDIHPQQDVEYIERINNLKLQRILQNRLRKKRKRSLRRQLGVENQFVKKLT